MEKSIGDIILELQDIRYACGNIIDREGTYTSDRLREVIKDLEYYLPST